MSNQIDIKKERQDNMIWYNKTTHVTKETSNMNGRTTFTSIKKQHK